MNHQIAIAAEKLFAELKDNQGTISRQRAIDLVDPLSFALTNKESTEPEKYVDPRVIAELRKLIEQTGQMLIEESNGGPYVLVPAPELEKPDDGPKTFPHAGRLPKIPPRGGK